MIGGRDVGLVRLLASGIGDKAWPGPPPLSGKGVGAGPGADHYALRESFDFRNRNTPPLLRRDGAPMQGSAHAETARLMQELARTATYSQVLHAAKVTQYGVVVSGGALTAGAGMGGVLAEGVSTTVETVGELRSGDITWQQGALVLTAVAATALTHTGFADDALRATRVPHGFTSVTEFRSFAGHLRSGLYRSGYRDVRALFQGSAVTGRSFRTGKAFDVGRISDFDIALVSPTLFERAKALGVQIRGRGIRTAPLADRDLARLGLRDLAEELTRQAGRPVKFMIYKSESTAASRAPSILVP